MKHKAKEVKTPDGKRPERNREMEKEKMLKTLRVKFQNPDLQQTLLETGDKKLIELNEHDQFFGAVPIKCEF